MWCVCMRAQSQHYNTQLCTPKVINSVALVYYSVQINKFVHVLVLVVCTFRHLSSVLQKE